ncbi:MAG: hypothetical protein WA672_12995 [Candidatus Angelobacter sp.]
MMFEKKSPYARPGIADEPDFGSTGWRFARSVAERTKKIARHGFYFPRFTITVNFLDPCSMGRLTHFAGSIIAINNRKFIKSDTPCRILGGSLVREHPQQLERHLIGAFLALGNISPVSSVTSWGRRWAE